MDFKQFYLSAQGRVNRQQWWLKLVLPVVISIILAFVDMATGRFDPETGVGLFSGIFGLLVLIPLIGAIWILIELGFLKGTPGPNRFGPPVTD